MPNATTIAELIPDPRNPRKRGPRAEGILVSSLQEVGAARSIVIDEDGRILAGNGTVQAAAEAGIERVQIVDADGETIIAVRRSGLTEAQKKRLALLDNRTGELAEWDVPILAELAADGLKLDDLFDNDELNALLGSIGAHTDATGSVALARETLAQRFGVPPFSVLDARQGYWQERKRAWIALGIQSELGRGDGVTCAPSDAMTDESLNLYRKRNASPGGSARQAARLGEDGKTVRGDGMGRRLRHGALAVSETIHGLKPSADQGRKRGLARSNGQDLMRGEHVVGRPKNGAGTQEGDHGWQGSPNALGNITERVAHGLTVTESARKIADAGTGTSIFDPVLCELVYRWFAPKDARILDPFAGGSVRGIVAATLGHCYTGIDMRPEQLAANEEQASAIIPLNPPKWIQGDARNIADLAAGQYDLIFSCPPYADLERYSDDPADLSTMEYAEFLIAYREIIAACVGMLKEDRFAVFCVGDIRDKKGFYRNFVGDTVAAFQDAGATLYNEAILVTAVGSLPIRVGKQFGSYRKLGKTHQNVLGFWKGDPKKIPEVLGEVEFSEELPGTVGGEAFG